MRNALFSVAIAATLAASAAQADVSVCVNNKSEKARFATKCSSKERQEILGGSGGGGGSGDVRTISKTVVVPGGTSPGSWGDDGNFKENIVAELSCNSTEAMIDYRVIDAKNPHNWGWSWESGNICEAHAEKADSISMGINCGRVSYDGDRLMSQEKPTMGPTPVYMLVNCIKK